VPARQRRVRGDGPGRNDLVGGSVPGGYNLRLLTVVQAMSQLDAVYGEKEARTFATNHWAADPLCAARAARRRRVQRDARALHRAGNLARRSRSFSQQGHTSVSRNESDQRRALLLPQEFKELGSERLVVICENCKPILAEKIRYHREPVFQERLLPPPVVPEMKIEVRTRQAQQPWRYAEDEMPEGETFHVEQLARTSARCRCRPRTRRNRTSCGPSMRSSNLLVVREVCRCAGRRDRAARPRAAQRNGTVRARAAGCRDGLEP
jgi:hypothetical protein